MSFHRLRFGLERANRAAILEYEGSTESGHRRSIRPANSLLLGGFWPLAWPGQSLELFAHRRFFGPIIRSASAWGFPSTGNIYSWALYFFVCSIFGSRSPRGKPNRSPAAWESWRMIGSREFTRRWACGSRERSGFSFAQTIGLFIPSNARNLSSCRQTSKRDSSPRSE